MKALFSLRTSVPPYPRTLLLTPTLKPRLSLPLTLLLLLLLTGCGSSIESFYDAHKSDPGVTAVEVPDFVLELLKTGSDDINTLLSQVEDIRFMNLPQNDELSRQQLAREIDRITLSGYTDVYRRTELDNSVSLFTVKEKGSTISELIWFDQGQNNNRLLYLKGNFDPELISKLSDSETVDDLKELLDEQY